MSAGAFRLRQHAAAAVARLGLLVSGCAMLAGCYPLINDISTDRAQPPRYLVAPPADPAYDAGALAERTATAYPDLRNLLLPADPPAVFAAVAALAAAQGWQEAAREAGDAQRP
ncbi:MAG: hypothetical protein GWO16_01600, partial [Gammaproteobacteria bacterium]|nr:hypothetical protein [Gammaproteobacteria bacterium]NIR96822.1 hypothetical protein [Gammaproteobacteria bacterium]NIT62522.1 hypothetical protein [Gammaproteobacteria bacterium]NIV19462.1 hypothetical protein [Gammaproteobacteria bacterium]NIY31102.1 hypothetical protein [Gammaproteobacteria bacterium]